MNILYFFNGLQFRTKSKKSTKNMKKNKIKNRKPETNHS